MGIASRAFGVSGLACSRTEASACRRQPGHVAPDVPRGQSSPHRSMSRGAVCETLRALTASLGARSALEGVSGDAFQPRQGYPHPALRRENALVENFDGRLRQLAENLFQAMYKERDPPGARAQQSRTPRHGAVSREKVCSTYSVIR